MINKEGIVNNQFERNWSGLHARNSRIINDKIQILNCICKNSKFSHKEHMIACMRDSMKTLENKNPELLLELNEAPNKDGDEFTIFKLICVEL